MKPVKNEEHESSGESIITPDTVIEITELSVDNPGKGNCAFYAFAIGLIDIIQDEQFIRAPCFQLIFDNWVNHDPEVKSLYKDIINADSKHPDAALLNKLQTSLRKLVYEAKLNELYEACAISRKENEYQALTGNSTYNNFAGLFFYNFDVDPNFNELVGSNRVRAAINQLKQDKNLVKDHEVYALAPSLISLIYGPDIAIDNINVGTKPQQNSPILTALERVKQDCVWGTHNDLNYLANLFDITLHTLADNQPIQSFIADNPEKHIITVNNIKNAHWISRISVASAHSNTDTKSCKNKSSELDVLKNQDKVKFICVQKKVMTAVTNYCNYSNSIWFSLFHRHGATGRKRAQAFGKKSANCTDYNELMSEVVNFLSDKKNGNTHPHSFRTMLLKELFNFEEPLNSCSRNFETLLDQIKDQVNDKKFVYL